MTTFSKLKCVAAGTATVIICWVIVAHAEQQPMQPAASGKDVSPTAALTTASTATAPASATPNGKELFHREWIPGDPRSHGGDGLGPVFNDSSCVACHNLGGSGGGGPASKNVDIITAFINPARQQQAQFQLMQQQPVVQTLPGMILNVFVNSLTQNSRAQPAHNNAGANGDFQISEISEISVSTVTPPADNANAQTAADNNTPSTPGEAQSTPNSAPATTHGNTDPVTNNNTPSAAGNQPPSTANSAPAGNTSATTADHAQPTPEDKLAEIKKQKTELGKIHPGFLSARSVVLHRFSTNEKYEAWRMQMLGLGQLFTQPNLPVESDDTSNSFPAADQLNSATPPVNATVQLQPQQAAGQSATAQPAAAQPTPTIEIQVTSDVESQQKMQQLKTQAQVGQAQGLQGQMGNFAFVHSRRNPTALFGVGLIDQIPDQVLIEQAKQEFKDFPEIQGRVAKMKDGTIGRFGWKDQKASLYEFAMTACAVELGLDVPNHPQAGLPLDPNYKPQGHDLDQPECDALVAYLRNLPAPIQRKSASPQEAEILSAGEKQFAAVGCANCHVQNLGNVAGIYSDLLLHDMGPELGDSGNYGVFVPDTPEEDQQAEPIPSLIQQQTDVRNAFDSGPKQLTKADREKTFGALRQEWRTPPLWGVRDSGPYLHDGRAETLEQAIAFHGGEAANSAKQFFMLKPDQRAQVVMFLKSLIAPEQLASAQ
jgi:CxxC motif-containing protein (DUF1111 family)